MSVSAETRRGYSIPSVTSVTGISDTPNVGRWNQNLGPVQVVQVHLVSERVFSSLACLCSTVL